MRSQMSPARREYNCFSRIWTQVLSYSHYLGREHVGWRLPGKLLLERFAYLLFSFREDNARPCIALSTEERA